MLHFVRNGDQKKKTHQKSPPFFNATFPGKFEEKIHKRFLESGESNDFFSFSNKEKGKGWRVSLLAFSLPGMLDWDADVDLHIHTDDFPRLESEVQARVVCPFSAPA